MTLALTASEEYTETFMLHKYSLAKLNEHKVITKAKNDFEPASPDNAHHSLEIFYKFIRAKVSLF